jgi:hypothetical protein
MAVKAIETHYRGYHFRSRLAARWAVFFSALGLAWEHEPEWFDRDGVRHLPDFRLRNPFGTVESAFVEVKGAWPDAEGVEKARRLCLASDTRVYVFCQGIGHPVFRRRRESWEHTGGALALVVSPPSCHNAGAVGLLQPGMHCWQEYEDGSLTIDHAYVEPTPFRAERYTKRVHVPARDGGLMDCLYVGNGRDPYGPRLRLAYRAARSARFERGECPC